MKIETIETKHTDEPVCPYCFKSPDDPYDYADAITYQGDEWVCIECSHCGKTFEAADHVTRSFSTRKAGAK